MSLEAILAGIGAVLTAAAGVALIVREFRDREHRAARKEIATLTSDLYGLDEAYIGCRRYAHTLRQLLADAGIDAPSPPPVHQYTNGTNGELAAAGSGADVRVVGDPDVHNRRDRRRRRSGGE